VPPARVTSHGNLEHFKSTYARIRAGRDGLKRRNHLGTLRILR
jgi:hypothetical protein